MTFKNLLVASGALSMSLAALAPAQAFQQLTSNNLASLTGQTTQYEIPTDSTVDPSDHYRYVVYNVYQGSGNPYGYIACVSPSGSVQWSLPLIGSGRTTPNAVVTDGLGRLYISIQDDNGTTITCMSTLGNETYWQSAPIYRNIFDLAAGANGVFACGEYNGQAYMEGLDRLDGSSLGVKVFGDPIFFTTSGQFNSMAVDANGAYYAAGGQSFDNTGRPMIGYWDPSTGRSGQLLYPEGTDNSGDFKEIAVDPTSQAAIAVGSIYDPIVNDGFSYVATLKCEWDGSQVVQSSDAITIGTATGTAMSVGANSDGVYYATVELVTVPSPAYAATIHKVSLSPSAAMTTVWEDTFIDPGAFIIPGDLTFDPIGNPIVTALCTMPFTVNGKTFAGIHQFLYGKDGARIQRIRLGSPKQSLSNFTQYFPNDFACNGGGYGTVYAYSDQSKATQMVTAYRSGPDDVYKGNEDTVLTVNPRVGVLRNDPNLFHLNVTSVLEGGSLIGLDNVVLNSDGSFTATPTPNFFGDASFQYRTMDGAEDLGLHSVTIKVKLAQDSPEANDDSFNVAINSSVTTLNVLANDIEPDGQTLHISGKTNGANANIVVAPDRQSLTFRPKPGFSGDVTFEYTVKDSHGQSATATVTVTVG
jgi:hypothetical protein